MTLPYELVHTRQVWHIIKVSHRAFVQAAAMGIVNETVGSHLRFLERRSCIGARPSLESLVCATRLRYAGFRGNIFDAKAIFNGLAHHFGSPDPSAFHFIRKSRKPASGGRLLADEKYKYGSSCALSRIRAAEYEARLRGPSWLSNQQVALEVFPSDVASSWTSSRVS